MVEDNEVVVLKNSTKNTNDKKQMAKETITFPSQDGLTITADIYKVNNNPITILLCHQAGYSHGE